MGRLAKSLSPLGQTDELKESDVEDGLKAQALLYLSAIRNCSDTDAGMRLMKEYGLIAYKMGWRAALDAATCAEEER